MADSLIMVSEYIPYCEPHNDNKKPSWDLKPYLGTSWCKAGKYISELFWGYFKRRTSGAKRTLSKDCSYVY